MARAVSLYYINEGTQLKDKISFKKFCENHIYANEPAERQPCIKINLIG